MLSLSTLTWFRGQDIIAQLDYMPHINTGNFLLHSFFRWNDQISFGFYDPRNSPVIFYSIYYYLLDSLGIYVGIIERVQFYIIFAFAGISMYCLAHILGINRSGKLAAALLYMCLPAFIDFFWIWNFYSFIPLILATYIYGLKNKVGLRYIIITTIVWFSTITLAFLNTVTVVLVAILLLLYFLYYMALNMGHYKNIIHGLKFSTSMLIFFLLINSFWLLPLLTSLKEGGEISNVVGTSDMSILSGLSSSILFGFRQLSYLGIFSATYKGDIFFPYATYYNNPLIIIVTFLIVSFAFLGLILKKNKDMWFFGFIVLFGLFMMKGINEPMNTINLLFYKYVPFFERLFRNPLRFQIFVAIGISILMGFTTSVIQFKLNKIDKRFSCIFIYIVIGLILLLGVPIIKGDFFIQGGDVITSAKTSIPDYYINASSWLDKDKGDFRVLSLPITKSYQASYSWFTGSNPDINLFNVPMVSTNIGDKFNYRYIIGEKIENIQRNETFYKILTTLNIKYILYHRDSNWRYISGNGEWINQDKNKIESFLENQNELSIEASFGALDFYLNEDWDMFHIYAVSNHIIVNVDNLISTIESDNYNPREQIIIVADQNKDKQIPIINNDSKPIILYQRINPAKYYIEVENVTQPFWLVFSESYHQGWSAYINYEDIKCKNVETSSRLKNSKCEDNFEFFRPNDLTMMHGEHIEDNNHFTVNGYANGWYINPQELGTGENFTATLYFKPQSYFYLGIIISGITFIVCTGYLFWHRRKIKTT